MGCPEWNTLKERKKERKDIFEFGANKITVCTSKKLQFDIICIPMGGWEEHLSTVIRLEELFLCSA
jgi:hypothetical protein